MDPAKGILKIGPLSDGGFVRRCLLGAVAISVGSVSSTAFQMMALSAYFNLRYGFRYGLFFGALVSLTFCTIAQIAASCQAGQGRHPGRKPKAPSFLIFPAIILGTVYAGGGNITHAREANMLVLSRRTDAGDRSTICIGTDMEITLIGVKGDEVRIGIRAPRGALVDGCTLAEMAAREARGTGQAEPA